MAFIIFLIVIQKQEACSTRVHFLTFWRLRLLQELKNLIPKSAVGTLSSNSSNVIKLIIDAYNVSLTARSAHLTPRY